MAPTVLSTCIALLQHRQHACITTKLIIAHQTLTRPKVLVMIQFELEDLIVKQACEQSGRVPKLLWLAKDQIQLARIAYLLNSFAVSSCSYL